MVIKILVMVCLLLLYCLAVGNMILRWNKESEYHLVGCIVDGACISFAIFEVIAIPFLFFNLRFSIFYFIMLIFFSLSFVLGLFFLKKDWKKILERGREERKKYKVKWICLILLVVIQTFLSTYLYHEDDDDGYYIAIANQAVENDVIETNPNVVYNGEEAAGVYNSIDMPVVSWELTYSFLAKTMQIKPVIVAHSVLPAFLIPLCYMAVYCLAFNLLEDNKKAVSVLIWYAILNMFGGYLVRSSSCFLLLRIWQGKAVLANFIFPTLIGNCVCVYKKKDNFYIWIKNCIILLCGIGCSTVGIYLTPICYFGVGMPFLVYKIVKDRKGIFSLIRNFVLSCIPAIVIIIFAFTRIMGSSVGKTYVEKTPEKWSVWFLVTVGTWKNGFLILLILACLAILIFGKNLEKTVLLGTSATIFLTFLNPLLCSFVSQRVTSVGVYWRLWWLIPINLIIAVGFVCFSDKLKRKILKFVCGAACLFIIMFSGTFMYEKNLYFGEYRNIYKLPEEVLYISDYVLEKGENITILVPGSISRKIRQYDSKIYLPIANSMQTNENLIPGTAYTYGDIYDKVYVDYDISDREIQNALNLLKVRYLFVSEKELNLGENTIYYESGQIGSYYIYEIEEENE